MAGLWGDVDGCVAAVGANCDLHGGTGSTVSASALNSFATDVASWTCDEYLLWLFTGIMTGYDPPAGTKTDGEQCDFDDQCQSQTCMGVFAKQCGKCVAKGGDGDPCILHKQCSAGLLCLGEKCAAFRAEGEACGAAGQAPCAYPFTCVGGICGAAPALGTDCVPGEECAYARFEFCHLVSKKCVAFKVASSNTGPCGHFADGTAKVCPAGYRCDASGFDFAKQDYESTCVPAAKLGEPCGSADAFNLQGCDLSLDCRDGKCATPEPNACG